jgi:hypothetical protein
MNHSITRSANRQSHAPIPQSPISNGSLNLQSPIAQWPPPASPPEHPGYLAATTVFLSVVTPGISTSKVSPGFIACVVPGVPVKITSPGSSVM